MKTKEHSARSLNTSIYRNRAFLYVSNQYETAKNPRDKIDLLSLGDGCSTERLGFLFGNSMQNDFDQPIHYCAKGTEAHTHCSCYIV